MTVVNLSPHEIESLQGNPDGLRCLVNGTDRSCILLDSEVHQRALAALKQVEDWNAIQEGIRQADAGQGVPVEEAFARIHQQLGLTEPS